jgi:outer membrane receptor protein involved in Fe transport
LNSDGLDGRYSVQEGFDVLLPDSGFRYRFVDANTVTLVRAPQSEGPLELSTITIRGELLERDIQDSQTSVVVIAGEELEERGETSLFQTLNRIPGVSTVNGLVIRGITDDGGLGNATTNSTISVTADGIRFSDFRNSGGTGGISTWDVEQVEVFRGSQSTQTGRNALAGAIVVEGAKPKFFPEYRARLGITEDEDFEDADPGYLAALVLNTPLVEDQLAVRLSVDKQETEDFADNQTIRAGLLYEPMDRLSFGLTYTDIDNGTDVPLQFRSPRLTADYQINDALTFTSRTQYTDAKTGVDLGIAERERDYETFDQEFRLIYETDRARAIGGLFYTNLDEVSVLRTIGAGPVTGTLDEDIETKNYAVYGEAEYDLSPQWTVIAGLRYDEEEVENTQVLNGFLFGTPVSGSGTLDTAYDAFLPKLGVVYNFDENMSFGLTYQRGYRAGGIGITLPFTGGPAFAYEFDPEFTDTFELAFRSQSSDGRRIFNANVYYTDWSDQQVFIPDAFGNVFVSNAADSELWGAEVDYRQVVKDNLEVFVSAAFSQTKYGESPGGGAQFSGNTFPFAPEVVTSLGAAYSFDNGLSIGGDAIYTSSTFSDPANSPELENDAYWVTNVNANYVLQNDWVLTAYARNLFDEAYTTQKTATGFVGTGPGREYGLSLTANF